MKKINIVIILGCNNFSCLINDIEWIDYTNKESKHYNISLLDNVCEELISEVIEQYHLPSWIITYFYDVSYETLCSQNTFLKLVLNNKNVIKEYLDTNDGCVEPIYKWKLKIDIKDTKCKLK